MDAVIIATHWLPSRTPRGVMNERLFEALPWRGDVFTVAERSGGRAHAPSPSRYAFHRVRSPFGRTLERLERHLGLGLGRMPDRHVLWAAGVAAKVAARCARRRPDVLVTVSKSDSGHLSALAVKAWKRRLPWVALFADPWTDMERFGFVRYSRATRIVNRGLEAAVMRGADAFVFMSDEARALLAARYPAAAPRMHVISQCYDPALYPPARPRGDGRVLVRYLGDLYDPRSPRPLLDAVLALERETPRLHERLRVELVGPDWCAAAGEHRALIARSRCLSHVTGVDYRTSLAYMVESDALLVLDAPTDQVSPFLPSKLVDYLGADRPIVGLTGPGAAARVIREAGGLVADVRRPEEIQATLRALLADGALPRLRPRPEVRERYARPVVAARFHALVSAVAA